MVEAKSHHALGGLALHSGEITAATEHLDTARRLFSNLKASAWREKTLRLLTEIEDRARQVA